MEDVSVNRAYIAIFIADLDVLEIDLRRVNIHIPAHVVLHIEVIHQHHAFVKFQLGADLRLRRRTGDAAGAVEVTDLDRDNVPEVRLEQGNIKRLRLEGNVDIVGIQLRKIIAFEFDVLEQVPVKILGECRKAIHFYHLLRAVVSTFHFGIANQFVVQHQPVKIKIAVDDPVAKHAIHTGIPGEHPIQRQLCISQQAVELAQLKVLHEDIDLLAAVGRHTPVEGDQLVLVVKGDGLYRDVKRRVDEDRVELHDLPGAVIDHKFHAVEIDLCLRVAKNNIAGNVPLVIGFGKIIPTHVEAGNLIVGHHLERGIPEGKTVGKVNASGVVFDAHPVDE